MAHSSILDRSQAPVLRPPTARVPACATPHRVEAAGPTPAAMEPEPLPQLLPPTIAEAQEGGSNPSSSSSSAVPPPPQHLPPHPRSDEDRSPLALLRYCTPVSDCRSKLKSPSGTHHMDHHHVVFLSTTQTIQPRPRPIVHDGHCPCAPLPTPYPRPLPPPGRDP